MRKGNEFDLKEGWTIIRVALENKKTDNCSNYRFLKRNNFRITSTFSMIPQHIY